MGTNAISNEPHASISAVPGVSPDAQPGGLSDGVSPPGVIGRGVFAPLGRLASSIYGRIIARRNASFDAGRGVVRMDRPVISVGNLSVGGTGKTPMVVHLINLLRHAGRWPCVAMRGYRAGPHGSDEAAVYRRTCSVVPIVAQAARVEGLIELFATEEGERVDTILLDDGFQHRRLARQMDIVLLDATRSVFRDFLLPRGWLREPVMSLTRAHAIVVTHAERVSPRVVDEMLSDARSIAPDALFAVCRHEWLDLRLHEGAEVRTRAVEWLTGKRVLAACAIGNPAPFLSQLELVCGRGNMRSVVLRDHDPFAHASIARIIRSAAGCEGIVVTEKDWSKLSRVRPDIWPCPVIVPRLGLRFDRGADMLSAAVVATANHPPDDAQAKNGHER